MYNQNEKVTDLNPLMKFIELIPLLLDETKMQSFIKSMSSPSDSEALLVYVRGRRLIPDAGVAVFPIEETGDEIQYSRDGEEYVQLGEVSYLCDLIDMLDLRSNPHQHEKIAERLIRYFKYDA